MSLLRLAASFAARWAGRIRRTARVLLRAAWIYAARPQRNGTRVWYGGLSLPRPTDEAHAGIVKLQRMQPLFPDTSRGFNVLYMVSSRMPDGAPLLARLARRRGAKVVWNQNGVAYPAWHGRGWQKTNEPMAAVLHEADYVFYQSRFCQESSDRYLGARTGPSEVLYNAVDTTRFAPAPRPTERPLTLLLGGSQDLEYRVVTGLRTLALVAYERPDVRMLVTGRLRWMADEPSARRAAEALALELGVLDRVTFLGPYTQAAAPDVFHRADLLLHTKYNDPSPGTVVEAMACGLPVVYSRSGGVPEIVGADAGIGVATEISWDRDIPPDPTLLADAVLAVADRLPVFSAAARGRAVEQFDLDRWLRRHRDVFGELVRC